MGWGAWQLSEVRRIINSLIRRIVHNIYVYQNIPLHYFKYMQSLFVRRTVEWKTKLSITWQLTEEVDVGLSM